MLKASPRFLGGVFFISAATLSLELCLIRYFSISQHYHFAFLVISIAFLGYGASGSFLAGSKKASAGDAEKLLSFTSLLFAASILLSFFLSNSIRFDFAELAWDPSRVWLIFGYYILLCLPFFFAGLTISLAVTRGAGFVQIVYFADLFGAGAGTALPIFLFLPGGDKGTVLMISLLGLFASLLFSGKRSKLFTSAVLLLITGVTALFFVRPPWLGFRISPYKALPVALRYPEAKSLLTEWNAISRIDIIDSPAVRFAPGLSLLYSDGLPPELGLTTDGDGLTAVAGTGDFPDPHQKLVANLPSSYVYSILTKPKVLLLEPKGGLDVIAARVNDAKLIKIIEGNPLIAKILKKDLADFTGGLYLSEDVVIETVQCRTALDREEGSFDLVVFPLSDVFGSSGTGLYGSGENYLFTLEAFTRILESLTPDGMVSMSFYLLPPPRQEIRALATWIQVLENSGKNPSKHIISLRSWGTISLFVKNSPFSETDIEKLRAFAGPLLFDLVYYPGIKEEEVNIYNRFQVPVYHTHFHQLLSRETRARHSETYLFNIKPVTDNRPFFFNFFKFGRIKETYEVFGRKWLPFLQGEYLIFFLFVQAVLAASILILLPVVRIKARLSPPQAAFLRVLFYFGLLGLAFMFFEIILIQKFILFLGRPLFSSSIVIASLLISSGLGSLSSKKILKKNIRGNLKKIHIFLFFLITLSLLMFPLLFRIFLGAGFFIRLSLSVLSIFITGFFMGFPFPTGIRLLCSCERGLIPWGWAANAFFSVLGSISALLIAFWGGYSLVLFLAGMCYLAAVPFIRFGTP